MLNNQEHFSLNLNVRGLKKSATLAINDLSNEMIRQGKTVYRLGLGQSPFPVPAAVAESLRQNAHQKDYLPVQGLRELREAVSEFHIKNDNINCSPDSVLIGPGSKELMFLLQISCYGDLVVPTPCWVSYSPQAQIIGRRVVYLSTDFEHEWRLQPETLRELCEEDPGRPRIVILNYPGNPEGSTYSKETLQELAEIAREYDIILLSDEIYGKLCHKGEHISIARYYPEGTIISSGLSKWCGAGGWRLGTFTFPLSLRWLQDAMASVASETFTSTSAPIQYAAVRAFRGGVLIERYLAHSRRILAKLGNWCADRLEEAGARVVRPTGAFYLFPDFTPIASKLNANGIRTSKDLCNQALEKVGVAFLPGIEFGRPATELTARLAYVDFDGSRALAASEQIPLDVDIDEHFIETYCYRTKKGIDLLCEWISSMKE
ncbi:aminotransferase class I/II-fold pyridoxal phosphate-dependent enzyme [bacterium]|nr:aminotransferase class I/II-fold pyridoxal phosphate-dependent enzyme [bacterium]